MRKPSVPAVVAQTWGVARAAVGWVNRWWRQPDHFDWLTLYLNTQGIRPLARVGIAGVIVAVAALPVIVLSRPALPHSSTAIIVSPITSAVGAMLAVLWLFRWPSRMQSIVFSLASSACITSACLVQSEPRAGLLGCTAFAVLGGYIAFFHTAPYMAANFVVAGGAAAVLAVRLIPSYDGVLATCAWLLIMLLNVAFPLAAQSLVQMLGSDLRRSSRDALTGLLSRRAFYEAANNLLIHSRTRRSSFGVAIIDLDNFKRINDTRGHLVGDQALAEVGAVLRLNCPSSSVIGRIGGEEFVVADTLASPDLYGMAERSREAIATLGFSITASIGIAVAAMGPAFEPSERQVIERLIRSADAAMYEAKRAGGNRVWMAESEPHWHGHGTNPHGPPNELAGQNATESGHRPERPSRTEASWERS